MSSADSLAYWITEREAMRVQKENKEAGRSFIEKKHGYSNDPHMGTVRYCNVRREDDKVTRWLAQHWRPAHHAPWELTLARMVNYIPTLAVIRRRVLEHPWTLDPLTEVAAEMKSLREDGEKIWTSAYTISTCGQSMDKVDYVMSVVRNVRQCGATFHKHCGSLAQAHKELTRVDGLGSFLAAQVVADMKNTEGHPLQKAEDWHTWSAHGPGSLKGLTAFWGSPITPRMYPLQIAACWDRVKPLLPADLQDLHMQDFQNCLCEFSKYMRIREGGHARNRYPSR